MRIQGTGDPQMPSDALFNILNSGKEGDFTKSHIRGTKTVSTHFTHAQHLLA